MTSSRARSGRALAGPAAGSNIVPLRQHAAPTGAQVGRLTAWVSDLADGRIDLADFFRLLHELALASGEETFSLSTRPMVVGAADFVFSSAANSSTVGEAMQAIARAYNILHGAATT